MLMRFDPYRELDRLAEQFASTASRAPRAFPMDAYRRGEQFIVQFDLPGVEPAAIELTVEQNVLTVRAERSFEPQQDDEVVRPTASTACSRSRSRSPRRPSRGACRSAGVRTPRRSSRGRPVARRPSPRDSRPQKRSDGHE
jgi:Hsp20/alpha crystallin family